MITEGSKFRYFGGATAADLEFPLLTSTEFARLLDIPYASANAFLQAEMLPGIAVGTRRYITLKTYHAAQKAGELVLRLKVKKP